MSALREELARAIAGFVPLPSGCTTLHAADAILPIIAREVAAETERCAQKATSFLVGDLANGVPLRNPMAHEIAAAIRSQEL